MRKLSAVPGKLRQALAAVARTCSAVIQAAYDAGRAWIMSPIWFAQSSFVANESGGWRFGARRPFRRREALKEKMRAARQVFGASLALRLAPTVRIRRRPTEGLIANLLHVVEVLHRVRPDARVYVDWVLTGAEQGFRYGTVGDDVWTELFQPIGPRLPRPAHRTAASIDYAFWGAGKDRLSGRSLEKHRRAYHPTIARWLSISNEQVRQRVQDICLQFPSGVFRIGVHRRVGNVRVADLQRDGTVPSLHDFISAVQQLLAKEGRDHAIFLATDDIEAVATFRDTFGSRLILQDHVQRTTADLGEVHFQDWGRLSIADAVDVLVDALVLACCDVLIHASASVSTFSAIANPDLVLVRVSPANAVRALG
jgi:hypothetical protein